MHRVKFSGERDVIKFIGVRYKPGLLVKRTFHYIFKLIMKMFKKSNKESA